VIKEATKSDSNRIGKHTTIASEPTSYNDTEWHLITPKSALTVDEFGTEKEVPIEYDEKYNAIDPNNPRDEARIFS